MPIASINPAIGQTLATFPVLSPQELEPTLSKVESAFNEYRNTPFAQRAERLNRALGCRYSADRRIAAATLTGSEPTGQVVASRAGNQIKKTVLEPGGSDPFVVLPSADLKSTVASAVSARTIKSGHSSIVVERFRAAASIYDRFEADSVQAMAALTVGDPMLTGTQIGHATSRIRSKLHDPVTRAKQPGAKVLTAVN